MNQRSGRPAIWTAALTPLRLMKTTRLDPAVPWMPISAARAAAMVTVRAKCPLAQRSRAVGSTVAGACSAIAGSVWRSRTIVVAWWRMWQSSPIAMPWASSAKASIGPSARSAAAKAGATASAIRRWRAIASGEPTPSQKASPEPSFIGLKPTPPPTSSRAAQQAIDGEMIPHIAPAASREWAGASRTCPRPPARRRPRGRRPSPRRRTAPHTA